MNVGIEAQGAQPVEEVVEGDLRKLAVLEIGAWRNGEVLGRNDILALSVIIPLVRSGNKITGRALVCGTVVATHVGRIRGEPVVIVRYARTGAK